MTLERRVYMSGEEAAWLADKIVAYGEYVNDAARMLRRLSTIEQQRDELLAALKDMVDYFQYTDESEGQYDAVKRAQAAILKAECLQDKEV